MKKKCPKGQYYCFDREKCMPIPKGAKVGKDGMLVKEAAVSKKQQRFFGMVRAAQKGEMKNPSPEVSKVADDISKKDAKKFAKTKHKGLPEKKKVDEEISRRRKPSAIRKRKQLDSVMDKYDKLKKKIGSKKKHERPALAETDYGKLKGWEKGILQSGLKVRSGDSYSDELRRLVKMYPGFKVEETNPRIPRKKGQPANSKKHSDLYTDENPKGTIHGLGFKDVASAKASVSKIRGSSRSHAHKIQAAVAMEQRAREMGKTAEAAVYRKYINSMKKKTKSRNEEATFQEMIDAGWEMTADGFWWPPQDQIIVEEKKSFKDFLKREKKSKEKEPQKAMDAGARAKRKLQRREYRSKVSEFIPKELED